MYVGGSQRMWESRAIVEALSKISKIRKPNGSVLNPAFLVFEKTRLALLRLADNAENPEATEVLLRENRRVIEAVVKETLGTQDEEKMLATVLERIGHKARYYDREENPGRLAARMFEIRVPAMEGRNALRSQGPTQW